MSKWVSVKERMPLSEPKPLDTYKSIEVIVTDGVSVTSMECASGCPMTDNGYKPWVEFTSYGAIPPSEVSHWMPLPELPEDPQ
ncbi:MAG: hypothetical protein [Bacteriophage sp.]|nr:MAG: hypothetical protein [Bacteriophage sp.]